MARASVDVQTDINNTQKKLNTPKLYAFKFNY